MNAYYRLKMLTDMNGAQLAELTLRTETTIIVNAQDLAILRYYELERFGLSDALLQMEQITSNESIRIPENQRKHFDTGFTPIRTPASGTGLSFAVIDLIIKEFDADVHTRLEGSVPNLFLVFSRASNVRKLPLTEANLPGIAQVVEAERVRREAAGEANLAIIGTVLAAVALAIELWRLYREEQDRARAEQEREAKEKERIDKENRSRTDRTAGGPAADDLLERIGGTA